MNLDGKVAVVTGATKGVGRGIGRELAEHGARVFVTGRSVSDHEGLDAQATGIRCDHRVDTQVAAAFEQILKESGAIHILVNNVWGGYERMVESGEFTWPRPFWQQPLWRWDAMFAAGARAHYHASQLAAPSMIAQGRGLIVNISSAGAPQRSSFGRMTATSIPRGFNSAAGPVSGCAGHPSLRHHTCRSSAGDKTAIGYRTSVSAD